jgi:hypothetical protein
VAEKTYEVTGPFVTHGAAPGETFRADLPEGVEAYLVEQGAVKIVEPKAGGKSSGKE